MRCCMRRRPTGGGACGRAPRGALLRDRVAKEDNIGLEHAAAAVARRHHEARAAARQLQVAVGPARHLRVAVRPPLRLPRRQARRSPRSAGWRARGRHAVRTHTTRLRQRDQCRAPPLIGKPTACPARDAMSHRDAEGLAPEPCAGRRARAARLQAAVLAGIDQARGGVAADGRTRDRGRRHRVELRQALLERLARRHLAAAHAHHPAPRRTDRSAV